MSSTQKLPLLTIDDVAGHNRPDDLWLVVDTVVYDLTEFAEHHPGGTEVLLRFAGRDATRVYSRIHAPSLISSELAPEKHVGRLDEASITPQWRAAAIESDADADAGQREADRPPLEDILSLDDFARAAERALSSRAWAYISTGTEDNLTRDANTALLRRIWLRPAVLRGVGWDKMDLRTSLFGGRVPLRMPAFVAPTGTSRTGGKEGELAIARGAAAAGIIPVISTVASYPYEEILQQLPRAEDGGQAMFQLYVDRDRARAEALLHKLLGGPHGRKIKAVMVTVDLPVASKREVDERARSRAARQRGEAVVTGAKQNLAKQTASFIDASFRWEDLHWLRATVDAATSHNGLAEPLPLLAKGIQRAEDARKALEYGCQGIVITNHGGRAADTAPPTILALLEFHKNCPEIFGRMEILIDGGFRRGSDLIKAICLGASAVGFGRPFIYSVGYGQAGVEHAADIIYDEIMTTMQLCGLTNLMKDSNPECVNTGDIDHMVPGLRHPYAKKPVWPAKL
ncbi:L-lactate dehydrogenase (cytochrome) [Sporothrix schenckii 1099-18]|uniref:L-lactate dehydrogenase (Cytochrome) n=1 Tax=Sporothrix schenckii 1099-18 TaxID=1397361 RepID=A0A0F2M7P5_SPOSC|nr:L-lactate dehydrogenase (cytochrome) [Sporothrix schenckii 1099-18]KJR84196.1 L-lactate dehydrogenase (cytochrome) [Sporothrix schenckii 1099-18]